MRDITAVKREVLNALKTTVPGLSISNDAKGNALPYAFVRYGGSKFVPLDGQTYDHMITLHVGIVCEDISLQSESKAHELIAKVLEALSNKDFGLGIRHLKPAGVVLKRKDALSALYEIEMTTAFFVSYEEA